MKGLLAAAAFSLAALAQAPATFTISKNPLAKTPVDPRIYGVLLEHIGGQMDTMWAELLQDNSFEGLRDYSPQTLRWAEGPINSSRFWWHSGYELHPWRDFGKGVSTAFANNIMHGMHAKTVTNRGADPSGIAQDGIPVRAGMTYHFSAYLSLGSHSGATESQVTVGLYADAKLTQPYATANIAVQTPGFHKYTADFQVAETSDNATFAITLPSRGFIAIDLVSLMPADNQSGWRADVVAAMNSMGLRSFRYPGGCFASFVDWESMVGPPETRLPFTNPFWGGLEPNHVGTDEFLRLTELVHGEPLLEVNLISGTPARAAAWVEYCNGSERTRYGAKRARNGHPKPYGVTYWELDNEVARRFSARQYAAECELYSAAMKAVDPKIKLMAVAYFWKDDEIETLLDAAAKSIDFLAVRTVDPAELDKFAALADRYSTPRHRILIASTEWRNKWRKDLWAPLEIEGSARRAEMTWGHALECARTLQEFQRRSDHIRFAMFPTVTNLYGEDLMQFAKSRTTNTANGEVFALMSGMAGTPLKVDGSAERLQVNALADESSHRIVCALVHGGAKPITARLDARDWGVKGEARIVTLSAKDMSSLAVKREESEIHAQDGVFTLDLPPDSVNQVTLGLP